LIITDDDLVGCGATRHTAAVIKSFRHKGVERFFRTGSKAGIQAARASRLGPQLAFLNCAKAPADMSVPGWNLHPLKGKLENHWGASVSGNWRLTFMFEKTATPYWSTIRTTTEVFYERNAQSPSPGPHASG
jgi:proteic killer suppression protein